MPRKQSGTFSGRVAPRRRSRGDPAGIAPGGFPARAARQQLPRPRGPAARNGPERPGPGWAGGPPTLQDQRQAFRWRRGGTSPPRRRGAMTELKAEADPAEVGLDPARLDRIDRHFRRYVDDGRLPGWLITVSRRGRLVYVSSYGSRDVEAGLPVETETLWRIYSMTKPITSV